MAAEIKNDPELKIAHIFIEMVGDSKLLIDQGPRGQRVSEH
jgi:hypothetical protein